LITALDLPDPSLRANVLDTLTGLVKEVSTEMELTISSVVLKVLKGLSHSTSVVRLSPNPVEWIVLMNREQKLRLSSLVFLGSLPACIPYSTLHPQKTAVLRALGEAVDDKKKEVRKAAVDCRSRWSVRSYPSLAVLGLM
jgi:DNA repair/transcription protein MET18/MMS19